MKGEDDLDILGRGFSWDGIDLFDDQFERMGSVHENVDLDGYGGDA